MRRGKMGRWERERDGQRDITGGNVGMAMGG